MADKKINDLPLQANPTGNMQLETDINGATPNKINLGDNPSDTFTTTSKSIMGAINELNANKAEDSAVVHNTGNESASGDKTFTGNIYGQQTVGGVIIEAGYSGAYGKIVLRDNLGVPIVILDAATNTFSFGLGVEIYNHLTLFGLTPITDVAQGSSGSNDTLATTDWITEYSRIINTNNSASDNYYAGLVISSDGDTNFTISNTPAIPENTLVKINGIDYEYGDFFFISGSNFYWNNSNSEGLTLKTTDIVTVVLDFYS